MCEQNEKNLRQNAFVYNYTVAQLQLTIWTKYRNGSCCDVNISLFFDSEVIDVCHLKDMLSDSDFSFAKVFHNFYNLFVFPDVWALWSCFFVYVGRCFLTLPKIQCRICLVCLQYMCWFALLWWDFPGLQSSLLSLFRCL